jgi:protein-S-isoprenylcysteine O-methyltransferase Ste14
MRRNIYKIIAATALFAGVHSLLATRRAKRTVTALVGERRRNALYRPVYNAVAVLTTSALVLYLVRLPDRELYRVRGPLSKLMLTVQLACVLCLLSSVRQIGLMEFAGLAALGRLWSREKEIAAEPEGQGPAPCEDGRMRATGPFRYSRHPLNFWVMPLLWLVPRMTLNLAAFNTAMTLYLVAGSYHEEARLREVYGEAYADYENSGVGFLVPRTNLLARPVPASSARQTS